MHGIPAQSHLSPRSISASNRRTCVSAMCFVQTAAFSVAHQATSVIRNFLTDCWQLLMLATEDTLHTRYVFAECYAIASSARIIQPYDVARPTRLRAGTRDPHHTSCSDCAPFCAVICRLQTTMLCRERSRSCDHNSHLNCYLPQICLDIEFPQHIMSS